MLREGKPRLSSLPCPSDGAALRFGVLLHSSLGRARCSVQDGPCALNAGQGMTGGRSDQAVSSPQCSASIRLIGYHRNGAIRQDLQKLWTGDGALPCAWNWSPRGTGWKRSRVHFNDEKWSWLWGPPYASMVSGSTPV